MRLTDKRDDSDIAKAIAHILDWNTKLPTGQVRARVEHGWVTLEGVVDHRTSATWWNGWCATSGA